MARKNQKLINYHTGSKTAMPSGSSVDFGEIVVRHNAETPELLIKIGTDSFGVFQASGAVKTAIDSAVSAAKTEVYDSATSFTTKEVNNVRSDLNELSGVVKSISTNIGENYVSKADFEEAQGKLFTSATTVASDDATAKANKAKEDAISAAAASATTLLGLVDADVKALADYKTEVSNTYATKTGVTSAIATAKSEAIDAAATDATTKANKAKEDAISAAAASADTLNKRIDTVDGKVDADVKALADYKTEVSNTYATQTGVTSDIKDAKDSVYSSATTAAATDATTKANNAKSDAIAAAAASAETLNNRIKAVDDRVDTLSGNVESLKTDLTDTINTKITNVYRYKGSCAYAALPTTGNVTGDVWNVTDAHDNVPAGTNYAWSEEENKWDALAGIVDLSPYAKTEDVNQTISTLESKVDKFSGATVAEFASLKKYAGDTYATKTELEATSGSIISDYTTAIGAAKKAVYDSATTVAAADAKTKADTAYSSAVTAAAASANTLQNKIDAVNSSVTGLSASTVNIETTANSAIQTASIVDGATCKVSVNKVDTELQFDFRNLVIDCGDF